MIPAPEPVTGAGARNSNPRAPARRPLNTPRTTVSLDVPAHQPRARPPSTFPYTSLAPAPASFPMPRASARQSRAPLRVEGIRTTGPCLRSPSREHLRNGSAPSPPAPPSPCRECPAPGTHTPAPCPTPVSGAQPHARPHATRSPDARATRLPEARATRLPSAPVPHVCLWLLRHTRLPGARPPACLPALRPRLPLPAGTCTMSSRPAPLPCDGPRRAPRNAPVPWSSVRRSGVPGSFREVPYGDPVFRPRPGKFRTEG